MKLPHWTKVIHSYVSIMWTNKKITCAWSHDIGRTHGAPYRGYGYVPLRFGSGGTSLGEWEHNNKITWHTWSKSLFLLVMRKLVIYILLKINFYGIFIVYHAFSPTLYNLFWKYSILSNEILFNIYFWNYEINKGDNLWANGYTFDGVGWVCNSVVLIFAFRLGGVNF